MAREGVGWSEGKGIGRRWAFDRGAEAEATMVRGRGSIGAAGLIRFEKRREIYEDGGVLDSGWIG